MGVSIDGMGNISPQPTWNDQAALLQAYDYRGNYMYAVEPAYEQWIARGEEEGLPKLGKMCIGAARMALSEADIKLPTGIITATGLGLPSRIEGRLNSEENNPFGTNSHDTLGFYIAQHLGCNGFNATFSQNGLSFESALMESMMLLSEDPERQLLVGGADEFTETSNIVLSRMNVLRKKIASTMHLFKPLKPGTIQGEGACYFAISGKVHDATQAELVGLKTIHQPTEQKLHDFVDVFLRAHGMTPGSIDLVLAGKNGDKRTDSILDAIYKRNFSGSMLALYKHLCGEYPTSSAFALWLAVRILKERHVPEVITFNHINKTVNHVLIINAYINQSYSLMLIRSREKVL